MNKEQWDIGNKHNVKSMSNSNERLLIYAVHREWTHK